MADVVIRFKAEAGGLTDTVKDTAKQFELLESTVKGVQDSLNKAQAELEDRTKATAAATKQLSAVTSEYRDAQARATEAAQRSSEAQRELAAAQRSVAAAQKANQRGDGAAGPDSAELSAAIARLKAAETASNQFREAQAQSKEELNAVAARVRAAREEVERLRDAQDDARASVTRQTKALQDAKQVLQESKNAAKEYSDSLKEGYQSIALGATAIAGTLAILGKSAIDTGIKFEQLRTALKTGLGSEAGADAAFTRIQNFASSTPFTVDQVTESFVKLQNRGVKPTEDTLRRLGDLTASQGKGLDQITEALLDAQTGEFERLKEFGIQAKDAGDQITFSFKGLTQTVDKTPESISKAILAFGDLKGVAGGMEAQSKTLGGALSNLQDNTDKLGQVFFAVAGGPAKALVGTANDLLSFFLGLPAPVQQTVVAIGGFVGILASAVAVFASYQLLLQSTAVGNTVLATRQAIVTIQTGLQETAQLALAVATGKTTAAQAAQIATLGKMAITAGAVTAAIASIALVGETYISVNRDAEETRKTFEGVNQSLKALDELQRAAAESANAQSSAADSQATALEKAEKSIGGVQRALDVLRRIANTISLKNLLEQFAKLEQVPKPIRDLINNVASAFPKLSTAAEASASNSEAALGDLVGSVESASNAFSQLKVKGFDKASKEEVDELTNAIDQSITAVEKSDLEAGKKKAYLTSLKAQKAELEQVTQRIKDQGQSLAVLGTEQEQLAKKNEKLTDKLARGIGTNDDAKQLTEAIARQREIGAISDEEAARQLEVIRNNSRLNVETTQGAEKAILNIKKNSLDQQLSDLQQQQDAVATQVANGTLSQAAADQKLTELKQQELNKRLDAAKEALQAEVDAGRGDGDRAKQLTNEIKRTESELSRVTADGARQRREQRLKDFDEQQQVLESQLARGQVTEQQFAQKSLAIGQQKADEELAQLREQLGKLDATDKEGREEINAKIAGVLKRREELQLEYYRRELALIERASKKAADAIALAETQRNIDLQRLVNAGTLTEDQANQKRLQATAQTLNEQLKLEQDNLAKIKALPRLNDPAAEAERQERIRAGAQQTANIQLQLLQNQAEQENALRQAAIKAIQNQAKEAENASKLQVLGLERVRAAQDAIARSIERQQKLIQAQQGLDRAVEASRQSAADQELVNFDRALTLRKQLEETDNPEKRQIIEQELQRLGLTGAQSELQILQKRQELEDKIAQAKLQNLQAEQERQRVSLELDLQREAIAAKRAVIETQIAQAQAQQQVVAAQSAVREAGQIKDPNERKLATDSANAQLAAAQQGLGLAQGATQAAQQNVQDQAVLADQARQTLATQQATERATANAAEKTREVDQALVLADAKAADLAAKFQKSADASAQIKKNLEGIGGSAPTLTPAGSPTPRKDGGPVVPGQDYLVGEKGPEVVRFGKPGFVYPNQSPVSQAVLNPGVAAPGAVFSNADVVAAIAKLQKTMAGTSAPVDLDLTNNFYGEPQPDLKAYEVAQEFMRFRR